MIDERCGWSSNTTAPANSKLRQYDAIDHILLLYLFRLQSYILASFICVFIQNYKFNIAALYVA